MSMAMCKLVVCGGALTLAFCASAWAQPQMRMEPLTVLPHSAVAPNSAFETYSKAVYFGDLNLSSSSGSLALVRRLERAASSVCGDSEFRDLKIETQEKACYRDAVNAAVAAVGDPNVLVQHAKRHTWADSKATATIVASINDDGYLVLQR